MGEAADDMYENEMAQEFESDFCVEHQVHYLEWCTYCEYGIPGVKEAFPLIDDGNQEKT